MSVSTATVNLIFAAKNLADAAIVDLSTSVKKVGQAGEEAAGRFTGAFKGMGDKLANGIGNAVETLSSGGSVTQALAGLGIYMAGQLAEGFAGQFIEKVASSGLVAALAAPMAGIGTAIGGFIAAAIPIGMAALPFILIGALVAAITVLIVNPEIRGKVISFVGDLVGHIGDALRTGLGILADIVPKAFGAVWQLVVDGVKAYVGFVVDFWTKLPERLVSIGGDILKTIVNGLSGLPGKIADIITGAFSNLHIDIGPFHISSAGVKIDLPNISLPSFAVGSPYVPQDMVAKIHEGEMIIPRTQANAIRSGAASAAPQGRAFTIEGVSESQLLDMVERGLYVRLRAAGTAY